MSSTTTPARATTSGRPSASRASTTPPTTGCCPTRSAIYIDDTGVGNTLNVDSSPRHADGARQPAILGHGDACRRLPLRSGRHSRPRARRLRSGQFDLRRDPAIAGAARNQVHRRALGYRPRGLSAGKFSARAGRNGTTAIATRCAGIGAATRACCRSSRRASPARPISSTAMAAGPGPPSIS